MSVLCDDVSTEYLEVDPSPMPLTAPPWSVACYMKSDDDANGGTAVFIGEGGVGNSYWVLSMAAVNRKGQIEIHDGTFTSLTGSEAGVSGEWTHLVGVERGTTFADRSVWTNGVETTATTDKNPGTPDRISIGRKGDSTPTNYMSGRLFWPAIWNIALGSTDVARLNDGVDPRSVRGANLVFFPRLDRQPPAKTRDVVGGIILTAVNTPTLSGDNPQVARLGARGRSRLARV